MSTKTLAFCLAALAGLAPVPGRPAAPASCGAGTPTAAFDGSFDRSLQGSYVLVPFDVPAGSTRVRVRICHDRPDVRITVPGVVSLDNTLDLGVYQPRAPGDEDFDREEFRGWGGSSRPDVLITPEASTTVGFLPGPIPAGEWAAEIGVAAVAGPAEGNLDGAVAWRLEVFTAADPTDLDDPWTPAPYDAAPANPNPGWYAGDMHVHAEHSSPNDADMAETFRYAFDEAGLDFVTLSDYVTTRHWDEIGTLQPAHPGKLVIRSAEVITYRGHVNNHASLRWADHRTGAIYERRPDGGLSLVRAARPASEVFDDIRAGPGPDGAGGWTQVNHPTIFPSQVPAFANLCRGCSWSYADAETDWSKVDAFEVQTGPAGTPSPEGNELGPNPFTPLAIEWFDRLHRSGYDLTAVGSSDSHHAGDAGSITQSPVGEATTVVYARELSEAGIRDGILAGHAYVKFFSPSGPDLRFTAVPAAGGPEVMMGDALPAAMATFTARVTGAAPSPVPRVLLVFRDGLPLLAFPVLDGDETFTFPGAVAGDYRLQLQRGTAIEALTNPITLTG